MQKKLIIAYPGTGAREFAKSCHKKTFFLDAIGYRHNGDYYEWFIDLQRFGKMWTKGTWELFVGWGQNWKGLAKIVGVSNLRILLRSKDEYRYLVNRFRETEQYRSVDLPMIIDSGLEDDHDVDWYLNCYVKFLGDIAFYVNDIVMEIEGDLELNKLYIRSAGDLE